MTLNVDRVGAKPNLPRSFPTDPRYEIVLETTALRRTRKASASGSGAALPAGVAAFARRVGVAIGEAYAVAASSVLRAAERLEDLNAERKFRKRSNRQSATAPAARPPPPAPPETSIPSPT
jgi:hypothetical protein